MKPSALPHFVDTAGEARALRARLEAHLKHRGINMREFAEIHGVPGGQLRVLREVSGVRPMVLSSAVIYARVLNVSLDDISPSLAALVRDAASLLRPR